MLKLMKYELRKTAFSKLVLLVITAVAEIAFLIGVFRKRIIFWQWELFSWSCVQYLVLSTLV